MWVLGFVVMILNLINGVRGAPQVPCFFIFGDSLIDNGNNNQLHSLAKANFMPHGIDFGGPTGRFSNGKTTVDVVSELLGFEDYIPSHATASGETILKGVNYASAAAGIRPETGSKLGERIPFIDQLKNHQNIVMQIVNIMGDENRAADYLNTCLYLVEMGSNDYINNYFMPEFYPTSSQYTLEQFANVLIQQYTQQLRTLYNSGARKVALIGVSQIGCTPYEMARYSPDGTTCVAKINLAGQLFNYKLGSVVDNFNDNLADAHFTYIDVYGIFQDLINSAASYGFSNTNTACCGVGKNHGLLFCLPNQTPCQNRSEYIYWDNFHPTEATNIIVGKRLYNAQSWSYAYPIDIANLAQL